MSTATPIRVIKPVAPEPIGDKIRLTDALEMEIRRVVREEMRDFLLAQRRAAKYIDAVVIEQLNLTTT